MRDGRQVLAGYPSGPAAALAGHDLPDGADLARALVLVEGVSDRIAVESLATRHGIDLAGSRIVVVATGGAQRMLDRAADGQRVTRS